MSKFNVEVLSGLKGELVDVSVSGANAPFKAEITDVSEAPINGKKWESFVVTMNIPSALKVTLEQGDYDVSHEAFGELSLFSSPNSATELEFVICRDRQPS
jgi:hypothetical protein